MRLIDELIELEKWLQKQHTCINTIVKPLNHEHARMHERTYTRMHEHSHVFGNKI